MDEVLLNRQDELIMKVVFLSNYFNHHQRFISEELNRICDEYTFVATSEMREERKKLGYGEESLPGYVLKYGEDIMETVDDITENCDVAILGSAPLKIVKNRVKENRLVFRYSERQFKQGDNLVKYIPRFIKWHTHYPYNKKVYLLCASAYAAYDYGRYGVFKNKGYKWGYFPETKIYDVEELMQKKDRNHILWCGRFLDWKHPDDVIKAVKRLYDDGYSFAIDFIGNGVMEDTLKAMVKEASLEKCVSFLGSMKPYEVRIHMERAGIYLFTSDKREGWGAVLNESMNSGCAVIASHAIGSVPYLVEDNENGLIYRSGDVDMLYEKIKYLLDNPHKQERLGREAYKTITEEWNADIAAQRLVKLSEKILSGEKYPDLYDRGPCSRADMIKDDWFGG